MKIKHTHSGYPERRNFLYHPIINFKQSIDLFKFICHLSFKLFKRIPTWALNLFWHPLKSSKTTLHFFNGICLSRQRFVTTFETALPRISNTPAWLYKWAVKRLASDNCLKIIAISQCTYNIQKQFIEEKYPHLVDVIIAKSIVLHPPQQLLVERGRENISMPLVFTFVGNQFFGKGGREVLSTFQKLYTEGYNFSLNIISNFSTDRYASYTTQEDVNLLRTKFAILPESINIVGKLANDKLLELLKESHVALMPTYADTYGYFVLEAQACGCPVITTDIRALPEINNNTCGWVINVPIDEWGNGLLRTTAERAIFSHTIERDLYKIVKDILENPAQIQSKAKASIKRIKEMHCPNKHIKQLMQIYS